MRAEQPSEFADIAAHQEHDHVGAIFPDRDRAERAIEELRSIGLGSDHLGFAMRRDEQILFEHDADAELLRDATTGAAAGASVGAIAGLALSGLAVSGIGLIGVGGMFAIAGASALWGGVVGSQLGAAVGEDGWAAHADLDYTSVGPDEVFVVVCSHGHADAIREIAERHGGRWREVPHTVIGAR